MVRLAYLPVFVVLGLSGAATADAPAGYGACQVTARDASKCSSGWASGNRYLIRASSLDRKIRLEWRYEFAENRDLRISVTAASEHDTETGTVVLIDNQTMLSHGLTLAPGQEFDTLGVPVLSLQLVLDLLGRAVPDGPSAVTGRQTVRDTDDAPLTIATRGAKSIVPAPWRLNGMVERNSPSRISFRLALAFSPLAGDADERVMQFAGYWEKRPAPPPLPDTTTIEGWAIHRIDRTIDMDSGIALNGFEATPLYMSFPTLGALRRYIRMTAPAGERPR